MWVSAYGPRFKLLLGVGSAPGSTYRGTPLVISLVLAVSSKVSSPSKVLAGHSTLRAVVFYHISSLSISKASSGVITTSSESC